MKNHPRSSHKRNKAYKHAQSNHRKQPTAPNLHANNN